MQEGFDVGLEMSGNPAGLPPDDRRHGAWRQDRHAGHSAGEPAIDWDR